MYSLEEVSQRAARANPEANNKLHFFASKFSIYFSWLFINLRLSANQVTILFFIVGCMGAAAFAFNFFIAGYLLWRLHIIFDLCDGDVARFNKSFSINGAYWDYMIHSILYPLVFLSICYSYYVEYSDQCWIIIGAFGSIVVSQLMAVKNNYYRAMLFSNRSLDVSESAESKEGLAYEVKRMVLSILSFEGFLFVITLGSLLSMNEVITLSVLIFYVFIFLAIVVVKFIQFSKKGFYVRRS